MPDAPPCGDDEHTAILQFGREDVGVEQEDETETRVLDAHLDGDGAAVGARQARELTEPITHEENQSVVDGYDKHNPLEVLDEDVEVVPERDQHHSEEHHNGEVLQGLVERLGYLRGVVCGENTQCQGHAEQDEHRDEDIPDGYGECL